jgi:hypothetical protein
MRTFILILILFYIRISLCAQVSIESDGSRPLNSIYISILGDASIFSFNYERVFLVNKNFIISSKLGLGYNKELDFCIWGTCPPPTRYLTIPHHITGNVGMGRHFFEFGLGGTLIKDIKTQPYIFYPILGYRIFPLKSNKINFRVFGQVPFSGLNIDEIIFVPLGLSLGVSF